MHSKCTRRTPAASPTEQGLELRVRLDIDPGDASTHDDRFVLTSSDGSYRQEKTVKDDQVPGDACLDLVFTELDRHTTYTLRVQHSAEDEPYVLFEEESLSTLWGAWPPEQAAAAS